MIPNLKQFVPSETCLKCDGCCRFTLSNSPWRPKTGQTENQQGTDAEGYMIAIPGKGEHYQCLHFNTKNNSCMIYEKRPFECGLYPFILSQHDGHIKMYMHLACPYIQDKEVSPELNDYVAYLKEFFAEPATKAFLKENTRLLHDYSPFEQELKFLFELDVA